MPRTIIISDWLWKELEVAANRVSDVMTGCATENQQVLKDYKLLAQEYVKELIAAGHIKKCYLSSKTHSVMISRHSTKRSNGTKYNTKQKKKSKKPN